KGGGQGRERVSDMVARDAGRVLAAVNADFFTAEGAPVGVEVIDGVVTSSAERPTFAWRPGAPPWMGSAQEVPGGLHLGWPTGGPSDATVAVGGFPDLIDESRRVGDLEVEARPSFAAARHPRTAVGWDVETDALWLVAVDGRQPPYSSGMTLPELAGLFEALGVEEALNLDGGGSTALIAQGLLVNRPSDDTGERPVVNALALVRSTEACR
ncbi:MAG: phosphodiester glycosidase family protein, partial [Gemmatimonadetes bacterium]|nr:phosphodiester glycosidase family protein [Gemmatimonadota bacterium]